MKDAEHKEQCAVVDWFRAQYPSHRIYAVPNGGHRHVAVASKLKREGVSAGVPDLCIPVSSGGFHGLYIELKANGGRPTQNQVEWLDYLSEQGYMAVLCVGADAAIDTIRSYMDSGIMT